MNPVQIAGMNAFTAKRRASIDASQAWYALEP
jgi:hypothetical protein